MTAPTYLVLGLVTVIFILAASVSRIYATDGRTFIVVIAMILYVIGNLLMVQVLRAVGLGVAMSVSALAQLILINVVAFVFFHERPAPLQMAGMALGLVSIALIVLPTSER